MRTFFVLASIAAAAATLVAYLLMRL
jgi:hypothetical protein